MKVGYVVLYVDDAEACRRFWIEQLGMIEKRRTDVGGSTIVQVGFTDQPFAFELVPLALMHEPWVKGGKMIVLEPRRLSARAAAERMAKTLN